VLETVRERVLNTAPELEETALVPVLAKMSGKYIHNEMRKRVTKTVLEAETEDELETVIEPVLEPVLETVTERVLDMALM